MNCIYCNSSDSTQVIKLSDTFNEQHYFDLCHKCGIYYLNPQPTVSQLSRAYDESYYGAGDKKFNPTVERILDWFRKSKAQSLAKEISSGGRVLDIGCGNGNFLTFLGQSRNYELYGIEPEGKSAERAALNSEINLHKGYLSPDLYNNNYFDLITLIHVFEHLPNPKEVLETITKIAKDDATLIIEIPNINSWQSIVYKGMWLHLDPPRHLNMFPPEVLKREVELHGWQLQKEYYFSIQYSPFGAQQSILNILLEKRDLLYEYLKGNLSYTKGYSRLNLVLQKTFHWVSFPFFILIDLVASTMKRGATVKMVFKKK